MYHPSIKCLLVLILCGVLHERSSGAEPSKPNPSNGDFVNSLPVPDSRGKNYLSAAKSVLGEKAGESLKKALHDPETLNHYLIDSLNDETGLKRFINDANLKFTTISGDSGEDSSLGISWDYSRTSELGYDRQEDVVPESEAVLNFATRGTVAFDSGANPSNLISSNVDLSWVIRKGGIMGPPPPDMEARMNKAFKDWQGSGGEDPTKLYPYIFLARNQIGDEFYGKLGANLGFETDQSFDNYQWTFGTQFYLDVKGWDTNSLLSRCNIFDYPAAFLRWILPGSDESFTPLGSTIPTVILGMDYVDPLEAGIKIRGGDESGFFRFKAEAATRSPIIEVFGEVIFLEGNLRFFQEISASSAIKSLGQDQQLLATVALITSKGWYISYSAGELPFDQTDNQFFEAGFKVKFD